MKTIAEVLERKQRELQRLQVEIEALRIAERLINEPDGETSVEIGRSSVEAKPAGSEVTRQFP